MGKILFTNNATSFLSTAASPADTFITIDAGSETLFPSIVTAGDYFMITVVTPTGELEIMKVTEANGNIFTVVRGQEDTTALALPVKSLVENRLTAGSLENNLNNLPDASTTQEGVIRIATDEEASTGTLENVAITPKHLNDVSSEIDILQSSKADKDLSTSINPSQAFKNASYLWSLPDYSKSSSRVNSYYTATTDCWIRGVANNVSSKNTINAALNTYSGSVLSKGTYNWTNTDQLCVLPLFFLRKGSSAHFVQINETTGDILYRDIYITIYPCIGAV